MLPTRRIRYEILKSLVRVKYDFGDGEDMRETRFEKDTDEVEDK